MHKHTRQQQCRSNDFSFDEYFNACGWLETSMYVRLAGALNSITRTSMHAIQRGAGSTECVALFQSHIL